MLSIIPPLPLFVLFLLLLFFSRNGFSQIHGFGSIDLKRMQAENLCNVVPPISRSTNYIALRYCSFPTEITVRLSINKSITLKLVNYFVCSIEVYCSSVFSSSSIKMCGHSVVFL